MRLSREERAVALEVGGLKEGAIGDLETTLGTVPVLAMNASCETEGEEGGIMEGDVVTANVHVRLSRFSAQEAGKGVGSPPSFAPFYPFPRGESWCVLSRLLPCPRPLSRCVCVCVCVCGCWVSSWVAPAP